MRALDRDDASKPGTRIRGIARVTERIARARRAGIGVSDGDSSA